MSRVPGLNLTATRFVQTMASQALRLALAAVTAILIARTLRPEGRGIYAMTTSTATFAIVVGHMSVWKSQIALWPDPSRHRSLVGNGLVLGLILGLVSAVLTFAVMIAYVPLQAPHLLVIALLAVPFGVVSTNFNGIALLEFRTGLANRAVVTSALALSLPVLGLAYLGKLTLDSAIVCWAVSMSVPCALFLRSYGARSTRGDAALARHQLALSGRYHIGLVAQHLLLTIDILLLNTLASAEEVGLYTVAGGFLSLAWVPTDAITQITVHRQATEDEQDAQEVTARAVRFNLLFSSAVTALLSLASPVLVPLLYGPAYLGSVAPLLLLAPGTIALSVLRSVQQYLLRLGRPLTMTAIALSALAANLGLNAVLIPAWGARGAAVASSVCYTGMVVAAVRWFARVTGVGMRELLPQVSDLRSLRTSVMKPSGHEQRPSPDPSAQGAGGAAHTADGRISIESGTATNKPEDSHNAQGRER